MKKAYLGVAMLVSIVYCAGHTQPQKDPRIFMVVKTLTELETVIADMQKLKIFMGKMRYGVSVQDIAMLKTEKQKIDALFSRYPTAEKYTGFFDQLKKDVSSITQPCKKNHSFRLYAKAVQKEAELLMRIDTLHRNAVRDHWLLCVAHYLVQ